MEGSGDASSEEVSGVLADDGKIEVASWRRESLWIPPDLKTRSDVTSDVNTAINIRLFYSQYGPVARVKMQNKYSYVTMTASDAEVVVRAAGKFKKRTEHQ